jgi:hypothetical protein
MPRIAYRQQNFRQAALDKLDHANAILREYAAQGYLLTLRQLYYQFVARNLIANTQQEYKKLGDVITNGRYAGIIDWNDITDRTRFVREQPSWGDPSEIIRGAASQYQIDLWEGQANHVEVWVEKDALVGVIERACEDKRLPFVSCRGYMSASEMWASAQRLGRIIDSGQEVHLLHLGDHDPSGIDMSRDIEERITEFLWGDGRDGSLFNLNRIALNMDQVQQYNPPPNFAKVTDSRAVGYIAVHGTDSWELDALEPAVIDALIQDAADPLIDYDLMDERRAIEEEEKSVLQATSDRWEEVKTFLA